MHIRFAVLFAFGPLLAACVPQFDPPPEYQGGYLWNQAQGRTITVGRGDTLYTISRRYNVPTRAIIARNGLESPYELKVGQQLILDPSRAHQVIAGDTLSKLARQYGVEMRLIASANDLAAPYTIYIGQSLWIPDPFSVAAAPVSGDLPPVDVAVPRGSAPRSTPIARQELAPPPGAPQPAVKAEPVEEPTSLKPEPPPAEQVASLPPEPKPLTAPPPRAASRFIWPLKGKIISGFGPAAQGLHNDGINIAADAGAEVRAADNGVVAYAGNELKGFGNLLLIKHDGGWITAYAHNDKLLVNRGDSVKQGQVISTVGRTGNVDQPQLHFEIRQGTQSLDPMKQLAPLDQG